MNKKKLYQKPKVDVWDLEYDVYMISGSNPEIGDGGDADDEEANSNRHRGEWGNLWSKD